MLKRRERMRVAIAWLRLNLTWFGDLAPFAMDFAGTKIRVFSLSRCCSAPRGIFAVIQAAGQAQRFGRGVMTIRFAGEAGRGRSGTGGVGRGAAMAAGKRSGERLAAFNCTGGAAR